MNDLESLCMAEIDRFRILRMIIRYIRRSCRKDSERGTLAEQKQQKRVPRKKYPTQVEVAVRAGVSQPSYNRLERATAVAEQKQTVRKRVTDPATRIGRIEFLYILAKGLDLPHLTIDAVSWLYGEDPLLATEAEELEVGLMATPGGFDTKALRKEILRLLQEAYGASLQMRRSHETKAEIYLKDSWGDGEGAVYCMECQPGMIRFATEFPPFLFFDMAEAEEVYRRVAPADQISRLMAVHRDRIVNLHQILDLYGGKMILSRESILHQLKQGDAGRLLGQLECVWDFMNQHEHFRVGLATSTPDLEFDLKSSSESFIQGAGGYSLVDENVEKWGPRYICLHDADHVLGLVLEFERAWEYMSDMEPQYHDRDYVMSWIQDKLNVPALSQSRWGQLD